MKQIPFYTPVREYKNFKTEFDLAIEKVLKRGDFILGKEVIELESEISKFTGAKYSVGVSSGTDALMIAADILGFKNGKKVITTPFTFFASVSCILRNNGIPVFVDVELDTCQIDPVKVEEKINEIGYNEIAGILPVHLFNRMSNMKYLLDISKKYSLKILEDAAESFGMFYRFDSGEEKHSGTIGDIGIFSFFPTKTLGGYGDGGMIITNNKEYYNLAKALRVHGSNRKYFHDYIGYNSRLDTLQAAILLVKLKRIELSIKRRNQIAEIYNKRLNNVDGIKIFNKPENQRYVYYVYNIIVEKRNELKEFLAKNGIGTAIYYPLPLHLQKSLSFLGYKKGDFPVSEYLSDHILALPIYPELEDDEIHYVCDIIEKFFRL